MNKAGIFLIVIVIAVLAYIKVNEPNVRDIKKSNSSDISIDVDQQALPDSAKGLVDEIKNEHENDKYQDFLTETEKEQNRQIEEQMREEERIRQEEIRMLEMEEIKSVEEIPFSVGTAGKIKWPCKTASFAEIVDAYNNVWGQKSVGPHDMNWYNAIANGLTDYAACRAVTANDPNVCDRLSVIDMEGNGHEDVVKHEFKKITDTCKEKLANFYFTLYSAGKASSRFCNLLPVQGVNGDICVLARQKRGEALCSELGFNNEENKNKCISHIPEDESECSRLSGAVAEDCNENIKIYKALKYDNVKLCPAGRAGVICMAYFAKESPEACKSHMDRLSRNFCSGGKYSDTRVPHWNRRQ